MKLHSLFINITIFALVVLFFICPPLFAFSNGINTDVFSEWTFPLQQLILFVLALFLYFFSKELKTHKISIPSKKVYFVFYIFTPFLFTFLLLFFTSLIFSFLSTLEISKNLFPVKNNLVVQNPDSFITWIYCILNFIFAAFYEEVIFRFYFIQEALFIFNKNSKKWLAWSLEIITLLLFALSHFYLGWLSVFNAAVAHVILRICYKKSGSIFPGFAAHFCYNIISLILL